MENTEKVEIGYTVPKERWIEAAKNLEDLGNVLAANLLAINGEERDIESGYPHLWHPACNIAFLIEFDWRKGHGKEAQKEAQPVPPARHHGRSGQGQGSGHGSGHLHRLVHLLHRPAG